MASGTMSSLESTLICFDNSEWSRNGDYSPTRFEAMKLAIDMICDRKTRVRAENAVGIVTLGGSRVDVRIAPTSDVGQILAALHSVAIEGTSDFIKGIRTAQLALKHRVNQSSEQRIICFFASPIACEDKALVMLGKFLKKNNVSLDIISIGDVEVNSSKLRLLFEAVNNYDTSHFVELPPVEGSNLSDVVMSSIFQGAPREESDERLDSMATDFMNEFGVDPNQDPELYLALRLSLETENPVENNQTPAPMDVDPPPQIASDSTQVSEIIPNPTTEPNQSSSNLVSSHDANSIPSTNTSLTESIVCVLPDADINDPRVQEALRQLPEDTENASQEAGAENEEAVEKKEIHDM